MSVFWQGSPFRGGGALHRAGHLLCLADQWRPALQASGWHGTRSALSACTTCEPTNVPHRAAHVRSTHPPVLMLHAAAGRMPGPTARWPGCTPLRSARWRSALPAWPSPPSATCCSGMHCMVCSLIPSCVAAHTSCPAPLLHNCTLLLAWRPPGNTIPDPMQLRDRPDLPQHAVCAEGGMQPAAAWHA